MRRTGLTITRITALTALTALPGLLAGCTTGAERVALDDDVGVGDAPPVAVRVDGGLAQIRQLSADGVELWAQAPEISVLIENSGGDIAAFTLDVNNALPSTQFVALVNGTPLLGTIEVDRPRPTQRRLVLPVAAGTTVEVALRTGASLGSRYRVVVMGDIQTALDRVDEVFDAINDVGDIEFVISTGDIVESAKEEEYDLFDAQLEKLDVPFYSTVGNHELRRDPETWHRRYGRFSIYFVHRDVAFSFVDSGNASLHPDAAERLGDALEANVDRIHLVGTHYPAIDPVGGRSGAFRSRKEASALLADLARGNVDATFYGHIHSYYAYSNAGIPAFISGGGGALPERWDGVGRHFLIVTLDGASQTVEVGLVRVD